MQKELQNGQKQKCKIYKLTKCSSSEEPTKGQSDLISHLSREICFRCQINYTTERWRNQKSCEKIHFHRHHELQEYLFAWAATAQPGGIFPDVLPKAGGLGATEAHGTGSAGCASCRYKHSRRTTPDEKFQLVLSWSWSHQADRPCVNWYISS